MTRQAQISACTWLMLALLLARPAACTTLTTTVTEADDGKEVTLPLGGELLVKLPAQLGSGFSWQAPASEILARRGSSIEPLGPSMPGAAELQVFRYSATQQGTTTMIFEYRQPWLKDQPAKRIYRLQVHVR